jgi:hypothetical protein
MSIEKKLIEAMDPLLDDLLAVEKRADGIEVTLKSIDDKIARLADEVKDELDGAFAGQVAEVKADFAVAVNQVKTLLDDTLGTITKQSRALAEQQEMREMAAVHFIVNEAALWGS